VGVHQIDRAKGRDEGEEPASQRKHHTAAAKGETPECVQRTSTGYYIEKEEFKRCSSKDFTSMKP
jgi:hypothetical protein